MKNNIQVLLRKFFQKLENKINVRIWMYFFNFFFFEIIQIANRYLKYI